VVYYEYMFDIAKKAKVNELKTMMITNGFINPEPLEALMPYMDAFNVDLKAFRDDFYRELSGAKLQPVLDALLQIRAHNKHLEITNLIIPGWNDDAEIFTEMVIWIKEKLGEETVLHISRYFPCYKLNAPPTPVNTIRELLDIASKHLKYVYPGNVRL
ncbi:MAG: AmmeMemoRadiSam system radical SAM enzyme, partial [Bacteroidales bacterium]